VPTHASALAIGHRLQEYIIGRLLGHGGFGLTYLAQDSNLNSLVAIKEFLPQEFAVRNPDNSVVPKSEFDSDSYSWGLERFKEEARALARFKHPNIVRVSRLLEANGTAYMVMDFEPGLTLSQYLKRHGPTLDEGKLLGLFLPVLDGLEALHRLQLVHRDIKPSNIYVRAYGGPMLIDFGAVRQAIGAQSRSLTSLVTPGYAPIEQYSSDGRQGAWSDLYAVGATLYYCMFGHAPADAARRSAAISDGSEDPYAAAAQRGAEHYSREILECVDWALQFRVRDRPQSAHAVREKLRSSPVPPHVIELPESVAEVPELQHGVMSVPTLQAASQRSQMRPSAKSGEEGATVVSLPTERHDSLGPLIEGTRRPDNGTEVLRPPADPLLPKIKATLAGWSRRFNSALERASQEPNTLTGRIATQLVKEPRGVRIAASALVIVLLTSSIVVFARRSGNEDTFYKAAVTSNTVQAWQDYLKVCKGCPHQADAQTALGKLQAAQATVVLETQFKDLLAKQQLAPPAQPNASEVLKQLEDSAPDDAFIPQAKTDLAAALKAESVHPAPLPVKSAAKPAVPPAKKTPPRKIAKAATRPAAKSAAAAKAATQAPVAAANEVMPKSIAAPAPRYPQAGKGQSGYVVLAFMVNVDGSTSDVEVVDSNPKGLFDDAAMHAVHSWLFSPYTVDGVRQRKRIQWRIEFKP
jgi:TonB family protein